MKKQCVEILGQLLCTTNLGIYHTEYRKGYCDEEVIIYFVDRPEMRVNVNGDSNLMIIVDVIKALVEDIGF